MDWHLAEAKSKFSELFNRALDEGPQRVRRWDDAAVVVIAARDYERLTGTKPGFKHSNSRRPIKASIHQGFPLVFS